MCDNIFFLVRFSIDIFFSYGVYPGKKTRESIISIIIIIISLIIISIGSCNGSSFFSFKILFQFFFHIEYCQLLFLVVDFDDDGLCYLPTFINLSNQQNHFFFFFDHFQMHTHAELNRIVFDFLSSSLTFYYDYYVVIT